MKLHPLLSLMSLAALACEQGRQSAPSLPTQTRDSAGIRIVENERPPDDSRLGWTIGPEPAVLIGLLEGKEPYMLHWATDATRLRDGRLVVANSGSNELRVFDADGVMLPATSGSRNTSSHVKTAPARYGPSSIPMDTLSASWERRRV
ncbi:MAG: hypothetical protein OXU74_04945 [Gemmatimonadota bacterium]|nr:hypothetical protein [Gemmatimonadota bacterium]